MPKWVFTGSTGVLGSKVLEHVLELGFNPQDIILSVYNPKGVNAQLSKIVFDVRHGDYNRTETLEKAFQGAEILFFVSSTTIINEKRTAEHRNVINAAKKVGIKHIYYTSLSIGDTREIEIMVAHLNTEDLIKASDLKYTIIREGIYSEIFPVFLGYFDANKTNEIVLPADGEIPFVARDDLGEATAKILVAPIKTYENQTILLTGSKTYTLKEIASIVSNILGRQIPVRFVTLEEYINLNLKDQSEIWVRLWATTYPALQRGEIKRIDPTLEKLLGRKAKPLEQTIKEMLTSNEANDKEAQLYNKYLQASTH